MKYILWNSQVDKFDSRKLYFNAFFCGMIILNGCNMLIAIQYRGDEDVKRYCELIEHVSLRARVLVIVLIVSVTRVAMRLHLHRSIAFCQDPYMIQISFHGSIVG